MPTLLTRNSQACLETAPVKRALPFDSFCTLENWGVSKTSGTEGYGVSLLSKGPNMFKFHGASCKNATALPGKGSLVRLRWKGSGFPGRTIQNVNR